MISSYSILSQGKSQPTAIDVDLSDILNFLDEGMKYLGEFTFC